MQSEDQNLEATEISENISQAADVVNNESLKQAELEAKAQIVA